MLLCTKNLGCNKLDGHRSPCEKRVVKITPELVTITYRKDGKTYLLSMPSEHAEWAEEMLSLDRAAIERAAAEKALTEAAEDYEGYLVKPELPIEDQPSPMARQYKSAAERLRKRAAALGLTAEQEEENDE